MPRIFPNDRGFLGDAYSKVAPFFYFGISVVSDKKDDKGENFQKVLDKGNFLFLFFSIVIPLRKNSIGRIRGCVTSMRKSDK